MDKTKTFDFSSSDRPGFLHGLRRCGFTCVVAHYMLWFLPATAVCVALLTYGNAAARTTALAAIALYFITLATRPQLKARGGVWLTARDSPLWRYVWEYFSLRVVRETELAPGGKYVFAFHPHGLLSWSRIVMFGGLWETLFPGVKLRLLGASYQFFWPGVREASLWTGVVDASAAVARRVLSAGLSVAVYPGGLNEMFTEGAATFAGGAMHGNSISHSKASGKAGTASDDASVGKQTDSASGAMSKKAEEQLPGPRTVLSLKNRLGFIRLAMENGASVVPVLAFGERGMYKAAPVPFGISGWALKALRTPLALFHGRWGSLLPYQCSLGVVFGPPMRFDDKGGVVGVVGPAAGVAEAGEQGEKPVQQREITAEASTTYGVGDLSTDAASTPASAEQAVLSETESTAAGALAAAGSTAGDEKKSASRPRAAQEAVAAAHAAYCAALLELWERRKADFGYGPAERLVIQ